MAPPWASRAWTSFTDRASQHVHVVVEAADGQGFALFGGLHARHQFTRLYIRGAAGARTRVTIHRRATPERVRDLCRRYGLVVFCGASMPGGLHDTLTVPVLVDADRDTPTAFSAGPDWSGTARNAIRRIAREGFASDLAGASWAGEFHERMFLPSMTARHGAETVLITKRELTRAAGEPGAEFVRVLKEGRPVAAYLTRRDGDIYRCIHVGWLDGDPEWQKAGAAAAAYWFSMQRAAALGCRRVSFGGCLPYLTDGVMQHKGYWGASPTAGGRAHGVFRWLIDPAHPTCRRFLTSQVIVAQGAQGALIALAGRSPREAGVPGALLDGLNGWYVWRSTPADSVSPIDAGIPSSLRPWLTAAAWSGGRP